RMPTRDISMHPHPRTGYFLSVAAALVWASTAPGLKYLLETYHIPSLSLAFWRDAFVALACLAGVLLLRPGLLRVSGRELRGLALTGMISIGVYHALWLWSVALNGAAVAVVLIYLFPTFVTIGGWLLFREPVGKAHVAALALALAGCALVVRVYDPQVLRVSWLGALVGIGTALAHSVYVLFSQRVAGTHSPWTTLTYTMLFGALTLLVMLLVGAPQHLGAVGASPAPWLMVAALAVGPTLGGYALFTAALRHIPGRTAGLIAVVEAPAAALLAVLVLGERLEWQQVVGMALVLGAIVLPRAVRTLHVRTLHIRTFGIQRSQVEP
ncbi:MAG TPA: DMT family transporter, partial [Roseiflexaceae bacterium]|nr:DMT family transporter [Roseiflexaceae bacterium]